MASSPELGLYLHQEVFSDFLAFFLVDSGYVGFQRVAWPLCWTELISSFSQSSTEQGTQ